MTGTLRVAVLLAAGLAVAGCTATPDAPAPAVTERPPPPAACLLDTVALAAATDLAWAPDPTTASDRRCVYDPAGGSGTAFVAVEVAPAQTAAPEKPARDTDPLETVAQVCEAGSRTPAGAGLVCRLPGGGVFAARTDGDDMVTAAAAEVPAGTTAQRLAAALAEQLGR